MKNDTVNTNRKRLYICKTSTKTSCKIVGGVGENSFSKE